MEKRKSRGEEGVEENCTAELEEKVKQPNPQDHGASSSQRLKGGKVHSAHSGRKEERRGTKGSSVEVSVATTGDSEPGPKPSNEGAGEDASGKPDPADIPQESSDSAASQSSLPSTVQASRHGSEETLSLPVAVNVDGAALEKSTASEQESTEGSANSHGGEVDTAGDRLDAGQRQLVGERGEEVTPSTALQGQAVALKGGEDAEGSEHKEPLPPGKANSDKTVDSEQDTAKSQPREGDQPEDCKDKDSGDTLN